MQTAWKTVAHLHCIDRRSTLAYQVVPWHGRTRMAPQGRENVMNERDSANALCASPIKRMARRRAQCCGHGIVKSDACGAKSRDDAISRAHVHLFQLLCLRGHNLF